MGSLHRWNVALALSLALSLAPALASAEGGEPAAGESGAHGPSGKIEVEHPGNVSITVKGEGSVVSGELPGGVEGQLLAGDFEASASPTRLSVEAHGALAQVKKTLGPCDITAGVGVVDASAEVGLGHSSEFGGEEVGHLKADKNGRYHRSNGQFASNHEVSSFKHEERNSKFSKATGGMVDCSVSASATVAQVSAECNTAVGTFSPKVSGPGVAGECDCTGCEARASLVWGELGYDSPSIGGCGLKASFHGSVEGGVGLAAGAGGAKKGVGARATLGPVGVSAGVSIDQFDPGAMGDCALKAGKAVVNGVVTAGKAVGDAAVSTYHAVTGALSSAGNALGSAASSVGHALCFWCSDDKPSNQPPANGPAPIPDVKPASVPDPVAAVASIPGTNVPRGAMTVPSMDAIRTAADPGGSHAGAGVAH